MELIFPYLDCALFRCSMHDGMLLMSLEVFKVSISSFEDEYSQGGDNATFQKFID